MILRLKTNINTETKLNQLQSMLQLSSKAAVMRICIAYSLKNGDDPRLVDGKIKHYDIKAQNGADYNRYTIFGQDEMIYRVLMQESLKRAISEDEFFPELTNAHIERGVIALFGDVKLAKTKERYLKDIFIAKDEN